jgi:hypothetical protein
MALPTMPPRVAQDQQSEKEGGGNGTLRSASRCDLRGVPVVPVKTFRSPAERRDSPANGLVFGGNLLGLFAYFDQDLSWWRTSQASLLPCDPESNRPSDAYSESYPASGMMRSGRCYLLDSLEPPTYDGESLLWPTPQASDGMRLSFTIESHMNTIGFQGNIVVQAIKRFGGYPLPELAGGLMGFPPGWTSLNVTGTQSPPPLPNSLEK